MNAKHNKAATAGVTGKITPTLPDEKVAPQSMSSAEANEAVLREVSSWEGVSVHEHRFGGTEFRVGRRELGHLHATFADLPFSRHVRDELIAARRARPHHVLSDSGWVTVPMQTLAEVASVIELFRLNYQRADSAAVEGVHGRRAPRDGVATS